MTDRGDPGLDARRVGLCELAAGIAVGGEEEWIPALEAARAAATDAEVDEVILQSYLFVGFPTVLNVLGAWRRLAPSPPGRPDGDLETRGADGRRLCRGVYGSAYERLREHVAGLHPDLDRWMIEEGYGKTLSRDGLPAQERELCVVAQLAASGQVPQLRSHLRGALNLGAAAGDVETAMEIGISVAERGPAGRPADPGTLREVWTAVREAVARERARAARSHDPEGADACS